MESVKQQGFIFGVWLNSIKKIDSVIFINGFGFNPSYYNKEAIRFLLKLLDYENYPRDEFNKPQSYTKLTAKQLSIHMEFITSEIYHCGYCYDDLEKIFKKT